MTSFSTYYAEARALFPLLPQWFEMTDDAITPEFRGLNAGGLPVFSIPKNYTLQSGEAFHEAGHAYKKLLEAAHPGTDFLALYWKARNFPGTWQAAAANSQRDLGSNGSWQLDPNESWAEAFANAVAGKFIGEKTLDYGKTIDPLSMRGFFLSLLQPSVVAPTPEKLPEQGKGAAVSAEWRGTLPAGHFMPGRDGEAIDRIVIHTTVGSASSADIRFHSPIRMPADQVSAHYLVRLDGTIWQWVAEGDTAYHAGNWDMNLRSIGIEHEDGGAYDDPRPDALYTASAALVQHLCSKYGIPIDRSHIIAHREVSATKCPDALDIERIVREAGGSMAFKDDPDAAAYREDVRATFEAIKAEIAKLAHHTHEAQTSEPEVA